MASSGPLHSPPLDLELNIISAKHLKNVNWRSGGILKPYAVFWIDPDRRLATRSDDSGSTKPVWNERFTVPLTLSPSDSVLTLEIFHSKPSETPKPLVATLRLPLRDLDDPGNFSDVRTYEMSRPSGRLQGKIRLKLALRERPLPPLSYPMAPPHSYYYHHTAPPPPPAPAPTYPYGYPDSYYQQNAYYTAPPSPRTFPDRPPTYGTSVVGPSAGPSAPVDYTLLPYEQRPKSGKIAGVAAGGLAGAMSGLALQEEGFKYEDNESVAASELGARTRKDYAGYRVEY